MEDPPRSGGNVRRPAQGGPRQHWARAGSCPRAAARLLSRGEDTLHGRDRDLFHARDRARRGDPRAHALTRRDRGCRAGRIERLNPRLNAYLTVDADGARAAARTAEAAVMRGGVLPPLHGFRCRSRTSSRSPACAARTDRVLCRQHRRDRRHRARAGEGRGRHHRRQDEYLPLRVPRHVRQPHRPAVPEPVEARPGLRRIERGSRLGRRRRARRHRPRLRRRGVDPEPRGVLRRVRPQALARRGHCGRRRTSGRRVATTGRSPARWPTRRSCSARSPARMREIRSASTRRRRTTRRPSWTRCRLRGLRVAWSADFGYAALDPIAASPPARPGVRVARCARRVRRPGLGRSARGGDDHLAGGLRRSPRRALRRGARMVRAGACRGLRGGTARVGDEARPRDARAYDLSRASPAPLRPLRPPADASDARGRMADRGPAQRDRRQAHARHVRPAAVHVPVQSDGPSGGSVPCGFTSDGLPAALQIVGRWHADTLVLQAAAAFEQAAPWAERRPSL